MLCRCSSLKELDLFNFNFDDILYKRSVLYKCSDNFQKKIKEYIKNFDELYNEELKKELRYNLNYIIIA